MYPKVSRAFRSPRLHRPSRLDNNGTPLEVVAISTSDSREYQTQVRVSCPCTVSLQHSDHFIDFLRQLVKARVICRRKCSNDDVIRFHGAENLQPYELTQSSAQSITLDYCMTVFSDNHRRSCMRKQGVVGPNIEMFSTQSSPCFLHPLQI